MKLFTGILSSSAIVALFTMVTLSGWGNSPLSWFVVGRVGSTAFVTLVNLMLICVLFVKQEKHSANRKCIHLMK